MCPTTPIDWDEEMFPVNRKEKPGHFSEYTSTRASVFVVKIELWHSEKTRKNFCYHWTEIFWSSQFSVIPSVLYFAGISSRCVLGMWFQREIVGKISLRVPDASGREIGIVIRFIQGFALAKNLEIQIFFAIIFSVVINFKFDDVEHDIVPSPHLWKKTPEKNSLVYNWGNILSEATRWVYLDSPDSLSLKSSTPSKNSCTALLK